MSLSSFDERGRQRRKACWHTHCCLLEPGALVVVGSLAMLSGCSVEVDDLEGLGGLACGFDVAARVDGDRGQVQALVQCEAGADCSDQRTVQRGGRFDVQLELPARFAGADLRVESSDPSVLGVEGFDTVMQGCAEGGVLQGAASFEALGDAALVVFDGEREVDRFGVSVQEATRVQIEVAEELFASGSGDQAAGGLSFDTTRVLRGTARSESGARLVAGPAFEWRIDHPAIAMFVDDEDGEGRTTGPSVWLAPVAVGTTTLHVDAGELSAELSLEVTGVLEPPQDRTSAP